MNIGRKKFKLDRQWTYIKYVQTAMVGFLFVDKILEYKSELWFMISTPVILIVGLIFFLRWIKFDYDNILKQEYETQFRQHPMKKEFEDVKQLIEKCLGSRDNDESSVD